MNFLSGFDKCKRSFFVASVWVLHPIVISIWKPKFRLPLKKKMQYRQSNNFELKLIKRNIR